MGSEYQAHSKFDPGGSEIGVEPYKGMLHVNGRAALRSIVESVVPTNSTIWVPSYICSDVYHTLVAVANLQFYADYPDEPCPRFDTLKAEPGHTVLIQDTFGLGNMSQWDDWKIPNPDVILIEDISHSSTQDRYLESPAHHAFTSLRKSLPVADGGLVFDYRGELENAGGISNLGSLLKLEAMVLKSLYLAGHQIDKQGFRGLQNLGEKLLGQTSVGGGLEHTKQLLNMLPHAQYRSTWNGNNEQLARRLLDLERDRRLMVLKPRGADHRLFHTVVFCFNGRNRDRLRQHLIANNVFPAVHWPPDFALAHSDAKFVQLADCLLTLPTDWRYTEDDIDRLAELVYEGTD